ncbi:winged helix-turn-helix transcriptional regulator [Flexivirga sp. ID2601S]|uniref:Winged helix-turn-helix transcriptional regulator n=1 Tax=Flexivirga aerilata TaxID=1656889 RepID=A0A849ATV1_9MICO|nr:metalloregulator ArsR/SmtB family transcription factor [Flexivirga aerilata]NNG40152.1 winged helix-turn-helix transcriptional regulator [Flexivirga aerilata]
MGHRTGVVSATIEQRLDRVGAGEVATTLQALATPSRLRILATLVEGPCAAGVLAERAGLEASACSHQLRLLRHLGLVSGVRDGRSMIYSLADQHVADLLEQAIGHAEHQRDGR